MFLTPEQTGGLRIYSTHKAGRYLAVQGGPNWSTQVFEIKQLAQALGQGLPAALQAGAGDTLQEHRSLILLACVDGRLFEWLNSGGE